MFAADTIYLVANPDIASVRNAHRLVDRFEQLGAGKDRLRILLNRMSDQHQIGPKQIETTLGHTLHMTFPSDYSVVSAAMNSGVPLTLTNHSELAAQFDRFTRQIVNPTASRGAGSGPRTRIVPGVVLRPWPFKSRQASSASGQGCHEDPTPTRGARSTSRCAAAVHRKLLDEAESRKARDGGAKPRRSGDSRAGRLR